MGDAPHRNHIRIDALPTYEQIRPPPPPETRLAAAQDTL